VLGIPGKPGFFLFLLGQPAEIGGQLAKNLVAVGKGIKAVILLNLSFFGERTCNNLQTNFWRKRLEKSFSTPTRFIVN
jgi:hypothetical protein